MAETPRAAGPPQPLVELANRLGVTPQALLGSTVAMREIRSRFPEALAAMATNPDPQVPPEAERSRAALSKAGRARASLDMITVIKGLQDLSADGALAHDPLTFLPDWTAAGVEPLLKAARSAPRAETVSPAFLAGWLACSARWIVEYAPHVLTAHRLLRGDPDLGGGRLELDDPRILEASVRFNVGLPEGMPNVSLSWKRQHLGPEPVGSLTVWSLVSQAHTACMIAIAAFAALSIDDFTALKVDCIVDDGNGKPVLNMAGDCSCPELAAIPVNELVVRALEVLVELTADARAELEIETMDKILCWHASGSREQKGRFMSVPLRHALRSFGQINGLQMVDPATGVAMSGDQLRKGYVIAMAYVLPGASSEDACRLARLSDPVAARDYVLRGVTGRSDALRADIEADKLRGIANAGADAAWFTGRRDLLKRLCARDRMFGQVLEDERVRRLWRIHDRIDVPGGRGGQALVETLDRAVRENVPTSTVNDPDAGRASLEGVIRHVAKNVFYEAVPGGHVHCTCCPGTADVSDARCLIAKGAASRPWAAAAVPPATYADLAWAGLSRCLGNAPGDLGRGGCRFASTDAEDRVTLAFTRLEAEVAASSAPTRATREAAEQLLLGIDLAVANGRPSKDRP